MDNPWDIDDAAYPREAGATEQLRFLVNYALLAPSSHNTQPWRFALERERLSLYADRSRRLPVVDPDDRALVISCGAALGNLLVAARGHGHELRVRLMPEPTESDLLARVTLGEPLVPGSDDIQLLASITLRRTTREVFEPMALPPALIAELERAGTAEGIAVRTITEEDLREAIGALVAAGDRHQFADPEFRAELGAWIRSRRSARHDGISAEGFELPDALSGIGALAIRTFDIGRGVAARDADIAAGSPLLAVLASERDVPEAWLRTGCALSRLLLRAAAAGVGASYLNQPIEVPRLRRPLARLVGVEGYPQLLLRLGYAAHARPSARRPLEQVLELPLPRPPSSTPAAPAAGSRRDFPDPRG